MAENYSFPKKRCFCLKMNNLTSKPKQIYGWNKNKSQMEIDNEHEIEDKSSNNTHHLDELWLCNCKMVSTCVEQIIGIRNITVYKNTY